MAPFLPVRAISRSQDVRIGGQTVHTDTTTYVDLGANTAPYTPRKELRSHQAIGAVIVVGPITATNTDFAFQHGGVVTASEAAEYTLTVTAGELVQRSVGEAFLATEAYEKAKQGKVAAAGKERIDLVEVDLSDGTIDFVEGEAAPIGKAVAPTPTKGDVVIAEVVTSDGEGENTKVVTLIGKA